ncbi:MAG: T9SS type A sorting domain-containing protein [Bacteroidales bacterium]|nr:T9SS type A sorting domain-containing protein [Bacteroidales bacterium]
MKRYFSIITVIVISFFTHELASQEWVEKMQKPDVNFYEVQESFYKYWEGKEITRGNGWKQFKRWEHFMAPRVDKNGKIPKPGITWQAYKSSVARKKGIKSNSLANWRHLGPVDVPNNGGAGRLNGIAFHPTNLDIMHVGAPSGGLWTTNTGGNSWSTHTDDLASIGISDIVVNYNDPNIIYAATGDGDAGDTYSIGVIKSTDGGQTWQATDLAYTVQNSIRIRRLIMHPTNPDELLAAANNGLFQTTDGGNTWNRIRPGFYYDVAYKPGNPNTIYLVASSILMISTDGGQTFTPNSNLSFNYTPGRLAIGVTPADSNYLYILASDNSDQSYGGLYLSTDGGNSFTLKSNSPNIFGWSSDGSGSGGQAWYDMAIAVSPINKNTVIVGGINIWRSFNAGTTWDLSGHWTGYGAPYVHADIHRLKFYPNSPEIYACTDGGLFVSPNNGTNWTDKSDGLAIAQIYRMGASSSTKNKIITGWQDNGTNLMTSSWDKALGGDGMEAIIDYSNDNIMYGSYYYGRIYRTTNNGYDWDEITDNIPGDGAWVTPYVQDPNDANTLFVGYQSVYKSANRGDTWTKISNFNGYKLRALAVAPSNSSYIYASSYYTLYRSQDGGNTWTDVVGNLPNTITYIAVDPSDPERIFVSISNYNAGEKVYMSEDAGDNWTNISGNLPNIPANTIAYEKNTPDGLYIGTDAGVYYRDSTMSNWIVYSNGLPNVIVNELEINYNHDVIRAATYGRGLWESHLYSSVGIKNKIKPELKLTVYPNPASNTINIKLPGRRKSYNLQAYSVDGALVKDITISDKQDTETINVSDLPRGVYHLRLLSGQNVFSGSFVKIH